MNRLLAHDDYIWNKKEQVSFGKNADMAKNLDTLLYMCPKCKEMYKMEAGNGMMTCKNCGNTITIDDKYNINPENDDSVCPKLVTDWTIMERERAYEDVRKEGFCVSEHVKIGTLPEYKKLFGDATSVICGDGMLSLDKEGIHFKGIRDRKPFDFDISPVSLPTFGMCTDISRLYTFVNGDFIEFYFDNNDVLRWDHLTEEMHRYCGGKWQNTAYRDSTTDQ